MIPFSLVSKMTSQELFDFIPRMVEDTRTLLFKISNIEKVAMLAIIIASLIWGTLMKLFIYYYISKQKISERPIHILSVADQIIHQVTYTVVALGQISKVSFFTIFITYR